MNRYGKSDPVKAALWIIIIVAAAMILYVLIKAILASG